MKVVQQNPSEGRNESDHEQLKNVSPPRLIGGGSMFSCNQMPLQFSNPRNSMWTATHEANAPSEDRYASFVNIILSPKEKNNNENVFIRMSLWAVFDGHGGGDVATYASQVLLPHIASNVSHTLNCDTISGSGEFSINGKIQHLSAQDLEELIKSCELPQCSDDDEENDDDGDESSDLDEDSVSGKNVSEKRISSLDFCYRAPESISLYNDKNEFHAGTIRRTDEYAEEGENGADFRGKNDESNTFEDEVSITKAISKSFLCVDEGWINSIDASRTQISCEGGGMWNVGSCALVVCLLQRIDVLQDSECDSVNPTASSVNSENGETNENDVSLENSHHEVECYDLEKLKNSDRLKAYDCVLYTAHCGDCRAVLGTCLHDHTSDDSRDISDDDSGTNSDSESDDDSSTGSSNCSDSDSSDFDTSDEEENTMPENIAKPYPYMTYKRCVPKRHCVGFGNISRLNKMRNTLPVPFLMAHTTANYICNRDNSSSVAIPNRPHTTNKVPMVSLSQHMTSTDLTEDHSAYNSSEVQMVLDRCKNAPRAISPACAGGIKRVAGSLAVTRALGDAYLKTPRLSFSPYKDHAPYISALPQVSRRVLTKDPKTGVLSDRVLVMASDGVWERASGKDVIRWIQTYFRKKNEKKNVDRRKLCVSRKRAHWKNHSTAVCTVSDYIVRRILGKVRRARELPDIRSLLELPLGRARRSKHDDITACTIDLTCFVC